MRLTRFTDYSLRVLMYAGLRGDRISTIADIAATFGISENHLMKVIHKLGQTGLIATTRGRAGGIVLAQRPEEVCIGDVVRMTENDFALVECFQDGPPRCVLMGDCVLERALDEATRAFLAVLDRYTLADLLGPAASLRARLGITDELVRA